MPFCNQKSCNFKIRDLINSLSSLALSADQGLDQLTEQKRVGGRVVREVGNKSNQAYVEVKAELGKIP